MSFWDEYDEDRPDSLTPEGEAIRAAALAKRRDRQREGDDRTPVPEVELPVEATPKPSQNDLSGVCDWCGIASDDVLLGVCADCA
jgi:hypothetical protein